MTRLPPLLWIFRALTRLLSFLGVFWISTNFIRLGRTIARVLSSSFGASRKCGCRINDSTHSIECIAADYWELFLERRAFEFGPLELKALNLAMGYDPPSTRSTKITTETTKEVQQIALKYIMDPVDRHTYESALEQRSKAAKAACSKDVSAALYLTFIERKIYEFGNFCCPR